MPVTDRPKADDFPSVAFVIECLTTGQLLALMLCSAITIFAASLFLAFRLLAKILFLLIFAAGIHGLVLVHCLPQSCDVLHWFGLV